MRSLSLDSAVSLVFWCQEWLMGDDAIQLKFEYKEVNPPEKTPHNSRTVTDSEESSITANRKLAMVFPMSQSAKVVCHP